MDYQTFCLKNGRHVDDFNENIDWNSELISPMRLGLSERWNDLERDLSATSQEIRQLIKRYLQSLKTDMTG